jgi:hypothetical protein
MKKVYKVLIGCGVFVIALLIWGYFAGAPAKIVTVQTTARGKSMNPTIGDGQPISVEYGNPPQVNDVISFNCLNYKCSQKLENPRSGVTELEIEVATAENITISKRLIKLNDQGCYGVEGDNKDHSYDSRNFGWLCPSDLSNVGIVKVQ